MPILPSHRLQYDEREHRSRATATRIRQLAASFLFLLGLVGFSFVVFGSVVTQSLIVESRRSVMETVAYVFQIPFIRPAPSVNTTEYAYEWDPVRPGEHCLRFATREYTSKIRILDSLVAPSEAMKACREIPIEIHGQWRKTDWCQDLGFGRGVFGFWIIDFNEPQCETRWGKFNELGCSVGSTNASNVEARDAKSLPSKRVESRLENLQPGSNWQIMCVTTPADIEGRHFGSPAACFKDPREGATYGEWEVRGATGCN
ncbi:hypothetical protein CPB83DRAFT_698173 [Crepidotus variabilis]|uniref:Uncharacterized protein n=1 Tax=Crepidotus variabilis TaxID=179855 RepID=A0A9P6JJE9_9AGAR|nr:hypothetical protein CPB83DRAFT_698173 [Crepidotus variabilis]